MALNGDATAPLVAPLARFDLADGSYLTLHRSSLVHSGGSHLETLPLAAVQMLRVGFERNERRVGWGIAFLILALLCYALSGPLSAFSSLAASEMASGQGVARFLHVTFRILEAFASLLPVLAAAAAIGGVALIYFGWRGATVLQISLSGFERSFATRGRDTLMLQFAATVSERLMALER